MKMSINRFLFPSESNSECKDCCITGRIIAGLEILIFRLLLRDTCYREQHQEMTFTWNVSFFTINSLKKNCKYFSYEVTYCSDLFQHQKNRLKRNGASLGKYQNTEGSDFQLDLQKHLQKFQLQVRFCLILLNPLRMSDTHWREICPVTLCFVHPLPFHSLTAQAEKNQDFTQNHHFSKLTGIMLMFQSIIKEERWAKKTRVLLSLLSHHLSSRGEILLILPHSPFQLFVEHIFTVFIGSTSPTIQNTGGANISYLQEAK